ncbi:MAG: 4'-phosphopantetheinyl transferase superfamily protein [Myxococcota bacterium]
MPPFDIAFLHASAHGVIAAVHLPETPAGTLPDPVAESVLATLPAAEAEFARTLRAYRQVSFVGGRIALRHACAQLGYQVPPILPDDRSRPVLPAALAGSISHKRDLAVGMASQAAFGTLGVDLEDYAPARPGIAEHVLRDRELAEIAELPDHRRWIALLVRFSIKESVYKALDPYVRRYVGFHEAIVHPDLQGAARVELVLAGGEGPFAVDARYEWLYGRLLTSVRIRPVEPPRVGPPRVVPPQDASRGVTRETASTLATPDPAQYHPAGRREPQET